MNQDNPFQTGDTPLYIQIVNVREALITASRRLLNDYGKHEEDAQALIAAGLGRSIRPAWYDLAWEVVSARQQLDELQEREKAEQRAAEQAKHQAALDTCPFKVGDRVLHKSGGSAKNGADARVGVVRHVYTVQKETRTTYMRVAKLSVDWPAPNRIGGDGWHRSDVLATAVVFAADEEVERRRTLNRERNARLEAQWRRRWHDDKRT